jgi:hypothetical protein
VQESLEEKLRVGDCVNRNVEGQWNNMKKFLLDTMSDCMGKVDKRARKPWITQEMNSKINEQRKWKMIIKKRKQKSCRRLNNELRRATGRVKLEYLEIKCDEITELQ